MNAGFYLAATVLLTVTGQVALKQGVQTIGIPPSLSVFSVFLFLRRALSNPYVLLGLTSAFMGAMSWLMVLARAELSFVYPPVTGLAIMLVVLLSGPFFGEQISWVRWLGSLVICTGVYLISRS